jgi:putative acetyltransferase
MGITLSVVVGEPSYYGRFGYTNRRAALFECHYQSAYLMALSFGAAPWEGRLAYPKAFALLDQDAETEADHRV